MVIKWNGCSDIIIFFWLKQAWFSFKKMQLSFEFWFIRIGTINSSTWLILFYYLISKNLSLINYLNLGEKVADFPERSSHCFSWAVGTYWKHCRWVVKLSRYTGTFCGQIHLGNVAMLLWFGRGIKLLSSSQILVS